MDLSASLSQVIADMTRLLVLDACLSSVEGGGGMADSDSPPLSLSPCNVYLWRNVILPLDLGLALQGCNASYRSE